MLVVPLGHRLADGRAVDLLALDGEDLIVTTGSRATILEATKRYSFSVRSVREAATIPEVVGMIASGRGVGWMAETTPVLHHDEVVSVPVAGYTSPVAIAWAATLSEHVREQIRAAAGQLVDRAVQAIPQRWSGEQLP